MKHSLDALFAIVYQYYPRGLAWDDPRYKASEATRKLRAARIEASAGEAYERWLAVVRRIHARFPSTEWMSYSTFLPTGDFDGGYFARLFLPTVPENIGSHHIAFLVSFLAPYYVIYRERSFLVPGTKREPWKDFPEDVPQDWSTLAESNFELLPEDEPTRARSRPRSRPLTPATSSCRPRSARSWCWTCAST